MSLRLRLRRRVRQFLGPPHHDELGVAFSLLSRVKNGVMVDVGAHHGLTLAPFVAKNWRVYAFEPDPKNREILLHRVSELGGNVSVDTRAVSLTDGDEVALFTSDVSTGISSLAPFHPSHHATAFVTTTRLDTALSEVEHVDFLKTDLEGHDLFALQSFPWTRIRPQVVLAEFEDRKTEKLGYEFSDLVEFLLSQNYAVIVSEWYPVVEYGQLHRWRRAFRYPGALRSELAWGNVVAVDPAAAGRALWLARREGARQRFRYFKSTRSTR